MTALNTIADNKGARHNRIHVGRGIGSGKGKTCGRGVKGQKSRSGVAIKGFEGGQMPLQRRIPKFGFKNRFRVEYKGINLYKLQELADKHNLDTITPEVLRNHGLVSKRDLVKVLGSGEISANLSVTAHAFSNTAKSAIEAAGGSVTVL